MGAPDIFDEIATKVEKDLGYDTNHEGYDYPIHIAPSPDSYAAAFRDRLRCVNCRHHVTTSPHCERGAMRIAMADTTGPDKWSTFGCVLFEAKP